MEDGGWDESLARASGRDVANHLITHEETRLAAVEGAYDPGSTLYICHAS
jgi:hypothetical protein